jgi:hypothetical protein
VGARLGLGEGVERPRRLVHINITERDDIFAGHVAEHAAPAANPDPGD